jgi:hypothetical protein
LTIEGHSPTIGLIQLDDASSCGGFATTGFTDQAKDFALENVKRHIIHGLDNDFAFSKPAFEVLTQVLND